MFGSASKSRTLKKIKDFDAFIILATKRREGDECKTPKAVFIKQTKKHPNTTTAIFGPSPTPNKSIKNGKKEVEGTERKKSIKTSVALKKRRELPSKSPIGIPENTPKIKPDNILFADDHSG